MVAMIFVEHFSLNSVINCNLFTQFKMFSFQPEHLAVITGVKSRNLSLLLDAAPHFSLAVESVIQFVSRCASAPKTRS